MLRRSPSWSKANPLFPYHVSVLHSDAKRAVSIPVLHAQTAVLHAQIVVLHAQTVVLHAPIGQRGGWVGVDAKRKADSGQETDTMLQILKSRRSVPVESHYIRGVNPASDATCPDKLLPMRV